ncbi:hypothetical protein C8R43DRAFT_1131424 [Mycena crocata]|nr:hypothetical protein C8R43DRAFT_1131424 [Mycena crocata]
MSFIEAFIEIRKKWNANYHSRPPDSDSILSVDPKLAETSSNLVVLIVLFSPTHNPAPLRHEATPPYGDNSAILYHEPNSALCPLRTLETTAPQPPYSAKPPHSGLSSSVSRTSIQREIPPSSKNYGPRERLRRRVIRNSFESFEPLEPLSLTNTFSLAYTTTILTTLTTLPPALPQFDEMTDTTVKLFKGDGISENATDFLNGLNRRYASLWFSKLPDSDKKTFKDLCAAFRLQWPAKEMAEKLKGEQQEELLSLILEPAAVGVRVEEDGILEWGHVRWARKVAEIGARVDKDSGLITQVLKNIPDGLLLQLGPKRDTWVELVQAMKAIPTANMGSMRREGERLASLEAGLIAANAAIAALQQTPTRGLTAAFSGMAASSPARPRADPVRRTLFPAAAAAARPAPIHRSDAER